MKNIFLLLFVMGILSSCSSDDNGTSKSQDDVTSLRLTLANSNGEPISGVVVYAYDQRTWDVIGDDPQYANFQSASNKDGVAKFSNITTKVNFSPLNNYTHTFRFSAHYSVDGTDKTKVQAITFDLGDDKADTMVLD